MKRKVMICSETIIKIIANNSKHWEYYNNIFYMIHWNYYIIVYIIIIKIIMIMSYVANFMLQSRKKK